MHFLVQDNGFTIDLISYSPDGLRSVFTMLTLFHASPLCSVYCFLIFFPHFYSNFLTCFHAFRIPTLPTSLSPTSNIVHMLYKVLGATTTLILNSMCLKNKLQTPYHCSIGINIPVSSTIPFPNLAFVYLFSSSPMPLDSVHLKCAQDSSFTPIAFP